MADVGREEVKFKSKKNATFYRVNLLVADLGYVDLDLDGPP